MTNDDNDPWALEWEDEFDDGEDFDDEDEDDDLLIIPSDGLNLLIGTHESIKRFANNPEGVRLLVQTLGWLEIACRALGWRYSHVTTPGGTTRVDVTTGDGREFSSTSCSGFATYIDPAFSTPLKHAYHDAVRNRVKEG
jgi:hypothetical protein